MKFRGHVNDFIADKSNADLCITIIGAAVFVAVVSGWI